MRVLIAAVGLAIAVPPVFAQDVEQPCTYGIITSKPQIALSQRENAPFTGILKVKSEAQLYDGTLIQGSYTIRLGRDRAGKSYLEEPENCDRDREGNNHLIKMILIRDPVAHTMLYWTYGRKEVGVATLTHQSTSLIQPPTPPEQPLFQPWNSSKRTVKTESIGSKNIAGVLAEGTRTTVVIPVGEEGNSQPITVTDDVWSSKELSVIVSTTHNDPRSGKLTSEFTSLSLTEPDSSLFEVPPKYTVRERGSIQAPTP